MISYDDIHDWWEQSFLRTIFWVIIQTICISFIEPRLWWFPPLLWFIIVPLAEDYQKRHNL